MNAGIAQLRIRGIHLHDEALGEVGLDKDGCQGKTLFQLLESRLC